MKNLNKVLDEMDFNFLGSGKHSMSVDALKSALKDDHYFFLDVRTNQELQYLNLPFATHIPLNELAYRLDELPKDKCIVSVCAAIFRGAVAYTFLRANGFSEVKCLTAPIEDLVSIIKPGPLAKILG